VRPLLFGILNITEDSFSDGGRFVAPEAALAQARKLHEDGADVLDIGAASSNPDSKPVPVETEIARIAPVLTEAKRNGWPVSIDSFSPQTQAWALEEGVDYLNDIRGFADAALYPALAKSKARLIAMHSVQGDRATRVEIDPETILARIVQFFETRIARLSAAGIARDRLILDPGMGFFLGSHPQVSLAVLRGLPALRAHFRLPMLISVSRKSFLRRLAGRTPQEAGAASLAAELYAALHGADAIRTHEPAALRDALTIWTHIAGPDDDKFRQSFDPG
jgi:dihydropteroate synthase type 2